MSFFAVFGNPVKHSKSSEIYALFAREMQISEKYDLKLVSENDFDVILLDFFKRKGLGANITVPFKERALLLCHQLTERAMMACSVNTIKKCSHNVLLGDNTDGIGLINDFKRLRWISVDGIFLDHNGNYKNEITNILIIGAGGASKGISSILIKIKGCHINIVNRTFSKSIKMVNYYHSIGYQNISYIHIDKLCCRYNKRKIYDLIINATTSSMYGVLPMIESSLIHKNTRCYDLFYHKEDTIFIKWCKKNGAIYCSDGLGMLVEQAACSFKLWHGFSPSTAVVLNYLKK